MKTYNWEGVNPDGYFLDKLEPIPSDLPSFKKLFKVSVTVLLLSRHIIVNIIIYNVILEIIPSIVNSLINTIKNINHTRISISDDIRNILCSSANMRRAIPLILRLLMN